MFNLIFKFFSWILSPIINLIDFPVVPPELVQIIDQFLGYLQSAMSVFNFFVPLDVIKPALTVFLVIFAAYHVYLIAMFIFKKIPFIGIQ